ncbi:hypothetical protein PEC18_03505 [Paucibacter sp. O1-1]|nr:hypothetical protein [Paucibacter sp. O1-1]MDA3824943.1 hypothetical protein [Paucibacter sp. O1-1]
MFVSPTPEERDAYVNAVLRAVKPGDHVIVATFAEDGTEKCSGLAEYSRGKDGKTGCDPWSSADDPSKKPPSA